MSPPGEPLLIVISAPSGAGKTTLCGNFLKVRPGVERAITCTTRSPRAGERDGADYHFLSLDDFERRVAAGEFLEHALVHGNRYGTLRREVADRLAKGRDVLLNIDVQGAESVRATALQDERLRPALVTVFLTTATPQELERRLRGRGTDSDQVIAARLAVAREELSHWRHFDYLIVSVSPEADRTRLEAIVDAEKLRTRRQKLPAFD